ncbi:hypothetical protein L226DRAFT_615678 [Lentinus tigrinus ALCF2SS1-7]|uniref:Ubiquitin 3 binding protein But2 C-terminal domain-containing protein n=1 Tax=Lentinus tigrinus ALCF2SS1-6 TaxID=1328759 RepID=A0A5C2S208_9APHY|nr:hypothetical protein L227DRAFT_655919 [Lentinus tigrinus ALCF2SS1-6]RPD71156.1 hypothetical protein L226DRAFT_615678 [Lentinus tigrinus ALCF2SS1-7]
MQLFLPTILSTLAVLSRICNSQIVVSDHGTTTEPADGAVITPGDTFPFAFEPAPFGTQVCFAAYEPIDIYLSTSPPVAADVTGGVNSPCGLVGSSFVVDFGGYVVPHFSGLPPVGSGFPPSNFTMPTLDVVENATLYLTVLESFTDCKSEETYCGIETTTVVYA